MANPEFTDLPWRPPRSYSTGRPSGPPRYITIHYTAGHEGYEDAENGSAYDMVRADGTSSHFYVDADSAVQCVATWDRSHTALYHGNLWGIHLELCGTLQTRAQWLDEVSRATIRQTAGIARRCMAKYGIPNVKLGPSDTRNPNARGIVGHYDWTVGWPEDGGDHTDPGSEFPWDVLLADIAGAEENDVGEITDPYQKALLANTEHYLQAVNDLADPVPGGISDTIATKPKSSKFARTFLEMASNVQAIKARPDATVVVDQAQVNTAIETALADPATVDALAELIADKLAARLRD